MRHTLDTANGIVVKPGCVQPGVEPRQRMIQGIRIVGNTFDVAEGGSAVVVDNAFDVEIQREQE